jgi:membrane-bound ClpP family serine protease
VVGGGLALAFLVVASLLLYTAARSFGGSDDGFSSLGDNIGVIDIDGEILSAESTVDQLRKYDQDSSIKAIILHIDSPGGAAAPSQEIYHEVLKIPTISKTSPSSPRSKASEPAAPTTSPREPTRSTPTTPASSVPSA